MPISNKVPEIAPELGTSIVSCPPEDQRDSGNIMISMPFAGDSRMG